MVNKLLKYILPIFLISFCLNSYALSSPVGVVKTVTSQIVGQLKRNQNRLKRPKVIHNIVYRYFIPHVDMNRMSASVVGRNHWLSASKAQKASFIRQFTQLVIANYSTALASFDNDVVIVLPLRVNYKALNTVTVRTLVTRANGQRIAIAYTLMRTQGQWKLIDFSVENVSMVQSYYAQFASSLSTSGMSGLIKQLIRHNKAR